MLEKSNLYNENKIGHRKELKSWVKLTSDELGTNLCGILPM